MQVVRAVRAILQILRRSFFRDIVLVSLCHSIVIYLPSVKTDQDIIIGVLVRLAGLSPAEAVSKRDTASWRLCKNLGSVPLRTRIMALTYSSILNRGHDAADVALLTPSESLSPCVLMQLNIPSETSPSQLSHMALRSLRLGPLVDPEGAHVAVLLGPVLPRQRGARARLPRANAPYEDHVLRLVGQEPRLEARHRAALRMAALDA
jgi:hypothetical protein